MGVSIFNTWFTYLRSSFIHDHIKKKSLKVTFSFYLFGLFKWIQFSLYIYWKFIIWLIIANYCFFYFSWIGDYVLNWSNTNFPCFMNFKRLSALAVVCCQHGQVWQYKYNVTLYILLLLLYWIWVCFSLMSGMGCYVLNILLSSPSRTVLVSSDEVYDNTRKILSTQH